MPGQVPPFDALRGYGLAFSIPMEEILWDYTSALERLPVEDAAAAHDHDQRTVEVRRDTERQETAATRGLGAGPPHTIRRQRRRSDPAPRSLPMLVPQIIGGAAGRSPNTTGRSIVEGYRPGLLQGAREGEAAASGQAVTPLGRRPRKALARGRQCVGLPPLAAPRL
jgi:hypothetical protein